jgi:EAL domain-containing protein (putative c-di-GMP-specific phosphodiesterase class I)
VAAIDRRHLDRNRANFSEVLLRHQRTRGAHEPEFLPVAQRTAMERIDRWVLENTARFLAESPDRGLRLSVNITG